MKFLFVTYCMGEAYGQMQIGVYKRGLRVAMELARRGHEVCFFCTGRHNFEDAQTAAAEAVMRFVEIPFQPARYDAAAQNRAAFLSWMRSERPDIVVIGEAPMAGTLLEASLAAAEAGIPVVLLDNAYHPVLAEEFLRVHGPLFDGVILSAPSALQPRRSAGHVVRVPPFIDAAPEKARALIATLGLDTAALMVVLAYDEHVEQLGLSLLYKVDEAELNALFITPAAVWLQGTLQAVSERTGRRARAIPPPQDDILFGLLKLARCAITKCGFMQVTESLSLHTPVIAFYFDGDFSLEIFPPEIRRFTHMAGRTDADAATVRAAQRFLRVDTQALSAVHDGTLEAGAKAANFLERLPRAPRPDTMADVMRAGFRREEIEKAIKSLENGATVRLEQVRSAYLRKFPDHDLHVLLCHYSLDDKGAANVPVAVRLWGRIFRTGPHFWRARMRARSVDPRRRVLAASARRRTMLELDLGEEVLPSIKALQEQRALQEQQALQGRRKGA